MLPRDGVPSPPTSSPGSGGTCSTAAGCASVARRPSTAVGPDGRARRGDERAGHPRRRRRAGGVRQHLPPPRPRAARLRGDERPRAWCSARTTPGPTSSTGGCGSRRTPGDAQRRARRARAARRCVVDEWGGWLFVNVDGEAPPFDEHLGGLADARWRRGAPATLRVGATHHYPLAANWKVADRELPRVLPLPADPPGAVPGVAGQQRDQRRRRAAARSSAGRCDLADSAHDDEPRRPFAAGAAARASTTSAAVRCCTSQLFPNLLLSLHPDYVMTHRIDPADADDVDHRVPVAVRRGRGRRARRSIRPSPSTSGTSPTARTGRRSSPCSAASIPAASCPACSRPTRTRCTTSSRWWPPRTRAGRSPARVIGDARPARHRSSNAVDDPRTTPRQHTEPTHRPRR